MARQGAIRSIGLAFAGVLAAGPAAAQAPAAGPGSVACKREMFFAEPAMYRAREDLEAGASATLAERCRLWRANAEALRKGRDVYTRCLAEPERGKRLAVIAPALKDMTEVLVAQCARPAKPVAPQLPKLSN